jgi:enoyl-CoA hydratase/carnithine racemase
MDNKNLSLEGLIFEAIELSIENNIMRITLNRPGKKNAINPVMANEIIYLLAFAAQERNIRVVIINANGDVFCAGGDLGAMSGESSESTSNVPSLGGGTEEISLRIRSLNKPVICEIQGPVFAGALLMVTNSTHAIAVEEATFSAPEIKRGIWPFMVMPKRQGLDFIMRGNKISSHDAERFGLVNKVVDKEKLGKEVNKIATELSKLAPGTMRLGLEAYNHQDKMDFDEAVPFLKEQLEKCLESDDAKEGITAFLEKRDPDWK